MSVSFADLDMSGGDFDLAQVSDAFVTLPAGLYNFLMTVELGENDKDAKFKDGSPRPPYRIQVKYKVQSAVELAEGATPPKEGTVHSEFFDYSQDGLKFFKKKMEMIAEVIGTTNVTQLLSGLEAGLPITAAVVHRSYKDKDTGETKIQAQVSDNGFTING